LQTRVGGLGSANQLMSQAIPEDKLGAIKADLFADRKIEAIKLYRECTGVGLAEAKLAVEALEAELRKSSAQKSSAVPARNGCFGLAMVMCLVMLMIGVWLVWM
jgi:ribosomal protein L7/L12